MARRNTRSSSSTKAPTGVKIGDTVEIADAPAAMVRLPDGTVVTARGTYTVRHPGEHAIVYADGAKITDEKTFTVTDPNAKTEPAEVDA